jgi:hypothetical protein
VRSGPLGQVLPTFSACRASLFLKKSPPHFP